MNDDREELRMREREREQMHSPTTFKLFNLLLIGTVSERQSTLTPMSLRTWVLMDCFSTFEHKALVSVWALNLWTVDLLFPSHYIKRTNIEIEMSKPIWKYSLKSEQSVKDAIEQRKSGESDFFCSSHVESDRLQQWWPDLQSLHFGFFLFWFYATVCFELAHPIFALWQDLLIFSLHIAFCFCFSLSLFLNVIIPPFDQFLLWLIIDWQDLFFGGFSARQCSFSFISSWRK
jgi:hypothetical protein